MADQPQRLNLGAGVMRAVPGWTHLDNDKPYPVKTVIFTDPTNGVVTTVVHADMTEPLPFGDDAFEGIVANHSLQCLTHDQILPCLRECRRVLKPGGVLRVIVPDIMSAFSAYDCRHDHWPGFDAITEDWDRHRKFTHYLTWGGSNRTCFTRDSLMDWTIDAGFENVGGGSRPDDFATHGPTWMTDLDSRLGESIVVEAW